MVVTLGGLGAQRPAVVYRPAPVGPQQRGRPLAPRQDQSRGVSTQPTSPEAIMRLLTKLNNDPGVQAAAQKRAQEAAQQQAEEATPWYKKGLGMVLGNPVSKAVLTPLNYLQTLGRGVTLGVEEFAENAPDWAQGPISMLVDTERTEADKRSNWEKLFAHDTDYGFGQLLDKDNPAWLNKTLGLVGDVGLDPLTYVSFGATHLAGAVEKGAKAAEAVSAASKADLAFDEVLRAAASGSIDDVAEASARAATHDALARRLEAQAEAIDLHQTPLRQGRRARESLVAELAQHNPELLQTHGAELTRAAERGFNTLKDPALREALGLQDPTARILGARIPLSGPVVRAGAEAGGLVRHGMNRAPLLGRTMERFTPIGLEESSRVLSRGAKGDALKAATTVRIQNLLRRGTNEFEGAGNNELRRLTKTWKGMSDDAVRDMFRQAEIDVAPNPINEFFGHKLPAIYKRITGQDMVASSTIPVDNYVPHLMTPEFKRFLAANRRDVTVEEYLKAGDFAGDDLLEGSHHLDKARELKPDTIGVPKDIDLAGRTITLTDGTIDELNEQLAHAFPEFKGKAYMDDPVKIGDAYISSVARQAGRDKTMTLIARSKNPLVHEVADELLSSVETRNKFLRTNPIVDVIKAGYTKGQRVLPLRDKGDMPVTPFDDMFAVTKHVDETQAQRDVVIKEGRQYVKAADADVAARRTTLSDTLKGLRDTLKTKLGKKTGELSGEVKALDRLLGGMSDEIKKLGPLTTENVDEMTAISSTIETKIADVKAEIKRINDRYGHQIPRDQARIDRELRATLRELNRQRDEVKRLYAQGTAEMREEADRRLAALQRPVDDAAAELERTRMAARAKPGMGTPLAPARVQAANTAVRQGFLTEEGFEAQREVYHNAIRVLQERNVPLYKTTAGTLTPESLDLVEQTAAELATEAPLYPAGTSLTDVSTSGPTGINLEDFVPAENPPPTPGAVAPEDALREAMAQRQAEIHETPAERATREAENKVQDTLDEFEAAKAREVAPIHPDAMAPPRPAKGYIDGEGNKLPDPVEPIPTYTNGKSTFFADPNTRNSGWGIRATDARYEGKGHPPARWLQGKQFNTAEEASAEIERIGGDNLWRVGEEPATPVPTPAAPAAGRPPFVGDYVGEEPPPDLSPGWWNYSRGIVDDGLVDVVDESSVDQLDSIYTLSDADTATFVEQMWDALPEGHKTKMRSLGWEDGLPPGAVRSEAQAALPPAPPVDTALRRAAKDIYVSEDGYSAVKTEHGWYVSRGDEDFGFHETLNEAKAEVKRRQAGGAAEPTPPEITGTPVPAEEPPPVPEPQPQPSKLPPEEPGARRRRWVRKDFHGTEVYAGPEGWTIEPFEESIRGRPVSEATGYVDRSRGYRGPEMPHARVEPGAPAQGPRRARYVALNPNDTGMVSRTFATPVEAKRAVEQLLAKREAKVTLEQYRAAGELHRGETVTVDTLTNQREIPPSALTPEQAAANREAAAAAPGIQRPEKAMEPPPVERELNPEAAQVLATRPPTRTNDALAYDRDWAAWRAAVDRSNDTSLTPAEQAAAKREAKTLGAPFTQRNGKYYNRRSANRLIIQDMEHQAKVAADEGVQAAQAKLAAAQAQADSQVEAMVYLAERNQGIDYTRLPSGSTIGFGEGAQREAVLPTPPEQGLAPTGTRLPPEERPWSSNYGPGERDADRRQIDSGISQLMMPENAQEFDRLTMRAEGIHELLDHAARNEDELRRLDDAAKAAYTGEMREADEAVKVAKLAEDRARPHADSLPGAADAYARAQQVTRQAVEHQTQVRQAWMQADQAWQAKLAERAEYIRVREAATSAEQRIYPLAKGEGGSNIVDAIREGRTPTLGNQPLRGEIADRAQDLQRALIEVEQFDQAGYTFLTDVERRKLAGQLVDIDKTKRTMINDLLPSSVKPAERVIPPVGTYPGEFSSALFGDTPPPLEIPPVIGSGQSDLQARAYAESLQPVEPREGIKWEQTPEGAWVAKPRIHGRQPYEPVTEREAIERLGKQADVRETTEAANAPELQRELGNISRQKTAEIEASQTARAEQELLTRAEQHDELLPLQDQIKTYTIVHDALHQKQKLVPLRDAAIADGKAAAAIKTGQKADLVRAADEIEKVAQQNVDLLDDDLAVTEALLQDAREEAKQVNEADLSSKQVQAAIDSVVDPNDPTLDIMLTTVGRNHRMLYEAKGGKKAVLQPGDIIVEAELHKRFTNLYDLKKDRVMFGRTFNAFTNLFKTYATLTPGFHVRNALSAIFMNTSDGVPLRTQKAAAGLWGDYMEGGEDWLVAQSQKIQDAFSAAHGSGAGGRFTEAGFAEHMNEGAGWVQWMERVQRNKATRLSQRAGERVEGSVRLAMAMHSMDLGESVESAIQRINRIHFDYGEISRLDETAKRWVPFWTFMSRNMPMQVSQMWTHPQAYLTYKRFVQNFSAENEELTPEYWLKAGAWNTGLKVPKNKLPVLGAASSLPIYMSPDLGFTRLESDVKDYEDFLSGKRFGGVLSNINPLISAPIELATRKDIFTQQQFEEGETVPMGGPLGFIPKMVAGALNQTEGGEVDAAFANFMRALNPLMDRQTRLLPQLTGNDPEGKKRQAESLLRTLLGAPVRTLTPKQQESQFYNQYYDELNKVKQARKRAQRQAG